MGSKRASLDERAAARLLWQMKIIAAKEVGDGTSTDVSSDKTTSQYTNGITTNSTTTVPVPNRLVPYQQQSSSEAESDSDGRGRAVSVESFDRVSSFLFSPKIVETPPTPKQLLRPLSEAGSMDHHDWSNISVASSNLVAFSPTLTATTTTTTSSTSCGDMLSPAATSTATPSKQQQQQGVGRGKRRKRETFVGLQTKSGVVRAVLRKKFSWKQYPELEEFLLANQEEYFEYSSRNYTSEQRKYNNGLTKGLLELASSEGYVFENFTFSMVRDRIRCYYKSHSQSAKKKSKR